MMIQRSVGCQVFNAFLREQWGKTLIREVDGGLHRLDQRGYRMEVTGLVRGCGFGTWLGATSASRVRG